MRAKLAKIISPQEYTKNGSAWSRYAMFQMRNKSPKLLTKDEGAHAEKTISLRPESIEPDKMRSLDDSSKGDTFELMFATKPGLPLPYMPISHSAIALKNSKDGSFSIYGRQSPWDFSQWLRNGVTFHTQKDNEKKYLSKGYNFVGYPTGVSFSQQEINKFLDSADQLINQQQMCNMYRSNCYSYSTTALSFAIEALLERPHFDAKSISRIIDVLEEHPLQDHFSIGVRNNPVVVDKLTSVLSAVQKKTASLQAPSQADKQLHDKADLLYTKLKNSSQDESKLTMG
ncbi:hypothetical protein DGG96_11815 [Legionella qingyii]|uniref:Uncharacterized protein n=1 Tax=Legionella qingyii TaxID=2184757 RepID=A0A317U274_9GAMM|nr:hypothetical protein [Legionella qingyii]PWY55459.1 hypothetical protein DGG96_11815 [Legionella qingyii]RUR21337.1 hypothetical protein ELY20_12620 [Legionella qingyii]RUR24561.1 hypothetical protein ELY16_11455 [Legionella qingyii]